jgi:hypothetical protein
MSHTFASDKGEIFFYNSDFSGEVRIRPVDGPETYVDCQSLLEFAAEYVRAREIEKLEQAEWEELLIKGIIEE